MIDMDYGYMGYQMPKFSTSQILMTLREQLAMQYNINPAQIQVQRIDEFPELLRHACAYGYIQWLPKQQFDVTDRDGYRVVYYYFCNKCGKLFFPSHLDMQY